MNNITLITKVLGKVVRSEENDGFCKIGVKFLNISEKQEDLIMKYVFHTLRKYIQVNRDDL
jgi:c-di-GMP-binding flagellar brake protein YcgR